ncbi:MAG TPA: hypothetical protein VE262_15905 [Blastocatellia bacterium]|nr:hypothetical protein [Blastocatellia bacterium]
MSNADRTNRVTVTDIEAPASLVTDAEAQSVAGGVMMDPVTGKTCTEPRGGGRGTIELPPLKIPEFDPSKIFAGINKYFGRFNLP